MVLWSMASVQKGISKQPKNKILWNPGKDEIKSDLIDVYFGHDFWFSDGKYYVHIEFCFQLQILLFDGLRTWNIKWCISQSYIYQVL